MRNARSLVMAVALWLAVSALGGAGQVKTNVPEVVPGARPATVERITIHGKALEGNLENDAVDRPVIVYLPASYARERARRYPVVYALHGYSVVPSSGPGKFTCRKRSRGRLRRARGR